MTSKKITQSVQDLRDEVRILRHRPGSVRRDIEIELIADRKRDEAARALRKVQKNRSSSRAAPRLGGQRLHARGGQGLARGASRSTRSDHDIGLDHMAFVLHMKRSHRTRDVARVGCAAPPGPRGRFPHDVLFPFRETSCGRSGPRLFLPQVLGSAASMDQKPRGGS